MASVRTFIAFNTPEAIRESITAFQSELRNSGADVRWESSDKFHVTIKFLGNVDESQLPGLTRNRPVKIIDPSRFGTGGRGDSRI